MIETDRLKLRPFAKEDVQQAHALFSDREAMRFVGMYPPFTRLEETAQRIDRWTREAHRLAITLKKTGALMGYIVINPDSEEGRADTRELGFALISEYRGHGYMKEAVAAVLEALAERSISYVWACCIQENAASERLIRSLGFELQQEGRFHAPNDREYPSFEFRITLQQKAEEIRQY